MALVNFYRYIVSPLMAPNCKYYPTCSKYAVEALDKHGTIKGCAFIAVRICKCNPFSKGGYDPVP